MRAVEALGLEGFSTVAFRGLELNCSLATRI